ncbi:hypothetical protein [Stanieria cyanosphaera]|uniref:hypothetical protein n=1 Tax=Stanieria cyanosphaera TaxID=102116 RepID=UPI0005A26A5C|nr:hypothetical protein [Stanieria cyanosphaera]
MYSTGIIPFFQISGYHRYVRGNRCRGVGEKRFRGAKGAEVKRCKDEDINLLTIILGFSSLPLLILLFYSVPIVAKIAKAQINLVLNISKISFKTNS